MNILIVDDEVMVREALSDFIEDQLGHSVTQSESAIDALLQLAKRRYPLILSDIRMPEMDGIELLRRIMNMPGDDRPEVIIISGHGDNCTGRRVCAAGAIAYLEKPIDILKLADIIEDVNARHNGNGNGD